MAGIGKYKKGKAFQLKSGNAPTFKMMGSSPLKSHDGTSSSATHFADGTPKSKRDKFNDAETQREISKTTTSTGSGADSTEGQDQNKIFDDKGKHIGNWKGDKKVLFKQNKMKKMSDLTPAEIEAMKLDKPIGKKSPAKHDVDPHVEHDTMTGTVNTKGTKVQNEKGKWVSITKRPDLVKEGTTQIGPGGKTQNISPDEPEEEETDKKD